MIVTCQSESAVNLENKKLHDHPRPLLGRGVVYCIETSRTRNCMTIPALFLEGAWSIALHSNKTHVKPDVKPFYVRLLTQCSHVSPSAKENAESQILEYKSRRR